MNVKKTISLYDLLTLIKERKNPKIIKCLYDDSIYEFNEKDNTYYNEYKKSLSSNLTRYLSDVGLVEQLIIEIEE